MIDWANLVAPKNVAPLQGQSRVQSNAWGYKPAVSMSSEYRRIAALPRRGLELDGTERAETLIDMLTERFARQRPEGARCRCAELEPDKHAEEGCITRLRLPQAQALREIGICGGLLGPIGVGHGKTLVDLLAALAFRQYDPKMSTIVLLVPAGLVIQLVGDYRYYGQHFKMPQIVVHGTDYSNTCAKMDNHVPLDRGAPVVHVSSYTRLSRPESTVWLQDHLKPDAIVGDEVHKLRNYKSATGARVYRYMEEIAPLTKFVGLSGSLTSRTIKDYCLAPSTRVLTADLRWVAAEDIVPGQTLVGFDEDLKNHRMKKTVVEAVRTVSKVCCRVTTDRGTVVCSADHYWVLRQRGGSACSPRWVETRLLQPGDKLAYYVEPWGYDTSREGGYLAGLLDGEGWIAKANGSGQVGFGQKPGIVLDRYCHGLRERGFKHSYSIGKNGVVRVLPNGENCHMRLLGMLRPERLMLKSDLTWVGKRSRGRNTRDACVLSIEDLGETSTVAIQTTEHTLVAEGLLSHNCHLAKWALRGNSPLPTNENDVDDWRRALDPGDNPADGGPLLDLCEPGESLYDGFRRRVVETLGVVTTATPAVDVPLELDERVAPPIPDAVKAHLRLLRNEAQRPDGEELLTSLEKAACVIQLACGFYYRWIYPKCEFPRDTELVETWKKSRKAFFCEVRAMLKDPEEHLDSPRLVMNAAERHHGLRPKHKGLPTWPSKTILDWYKVRGAVYAETQAVWFDDYLIKDAIRWATERNGVVWSAHTAVGERMAKLSGLPYFGAGRDAKVALLGDPKRGILGERGDRSVICSIKAHGTGTNGLQHRFSEALLLAPDADPNGWEQVLGRLHRPGQKDTVCNWFYRHIPELAAHIDSALQAAGYIQGTGFGHQKLLGAFKE